MKHFLLLNFLLLYLFTLGFSKNKTENQSSNSTEPSDTTELPIVFKKLKKTTSPDGTTENYIYENGLLVKIEFRGGVTTRNWIYEYDDNERIIKHTQNVQYPHTNEVTIATIHYLDDNDIEIHWKKGEVFEVGDIKRHLLIENNTVKQTIDSVWINDKFFFSSKNLCEYDENRNKTEDVFVKSSGNSTATCTYDNKRNKHYGLNKSVKLLFKGTNNNNQISVNNVSNHDTYTYEYTREYIYNADGYPIKCTTMENSVAVSHYYLEYYEN